MVRPCRHVPFSPIFVAVALALAAGSLPGCGVVPRSRMDECQKVSQLLREENARLKDRVLALQSQNRDYADRSVDDLHRLTARDKAIERLEQDIQAYQEDRERMAAAVDQLRAGLGRGPEAERSASLPETGQPATTRRAGNRLPAAKESLPRSTPSWDDEATAR